MRKSSFRTTAILGLTVLLTTSALATDLDEASEAGGYYGNLHASLDIEGATTTPAVFIPYLNFGGKVAYDSGPGTFGSQFDADLNYTDLSWISPTITSESVAIAMVDTAAHLTYTVNENNKVGFFGGVSTLTLSTASATGTNSGSLTAGLIGVGIEDIAALSDETSIQVRAAILDPAYISGTFDDGTGPQSATVFLNTGVLGYSVMGGLSHHITNNISARADLSYASFSGGILSSNIAVYNGALTGQYTFDTMPMSLGVTAGYGGVGLGSVSANDFSLGAKATYSFGGPSSGVTGKLFRSGLFSLLN
jgi:hypothetical protein